MLDAGPDDEDVDRRAVELLEVRGAVRDGVAAGVAAAGAPYPRSNAEMLSSDRCEFACAARFKSDCSASFARSSLRLQPAAAVASAAIIMIKCLFMIATSVAGGTRQATCHARPLLKRV